MCRSPPNDVTGSEQTGEAGPRRVGANNGSKPEEVSHMTLIAYREAASLLGLPVGTLYALVSRRQIPHVRLGRRLVRFDAAELTTWVSNHGVPVERGLVLRAVNRARGIARPATKRRAKSAGGVK